MNFIHSKLNFLQYFPVSMGSILMKSSTCPQHGCTAEGLGCSAGLKKDKSSVHCTICECERDGEMDEFLSYLKSGQFYGVL